MSYAFKAVAPTFYRGDTTFVHYIGNIDRGRICGYGKTQYPDKRVCHGITERVRLPLVRSLAEDLRKDREDNSKWANEGQCWVGGETNLPFSRKGTNI